MTRIPNPPARASVLDVSLCSTSLRLDCTWKVILDPHGSDHLPIQISIANGRRPAGLIEVTYDLTRNIDWEKYENAILDAIESVQELPPEEEYDFIAGSILDAAMKAQTKRVPGTKFKRRPPTPWWDQECSDAKTEKSAAYKTFLKKGTPVNLERYNVSESKYCSLLKAKKRGYWRRFVEGLSRETAMSTLWDTAKRMRNRNVTNESVEYSNRWIFDFARKMCTDSVLEKARLKF